MFKKMFRKFEFYFSTLLLIILSVKFVKSVHREKRFLVFPPDSPTRHQLIVGIGVPLTLEEEACTFGWTIKAQYFLPETADQLKYIYFQDVFQNYTPTNYGVTAWHKFPYGRKRREIVVDPLTGNKIERYVEDVKYIGSADLGQELDTYDEYENEEFEDEFEEEKPQEEDMIIEPPKPETQNQNNFDQKTDNIPMTSRWSTYDSFSRLFDAKEVGGRPCILRLICEAASIQFSQESGLLGEIMHILLTPSSTPDAIYHHTHYDYLKAEELGKAGAPCSDIFKECKKSLLDLFTNIYDTKYFTYK